MIQAVIFDMDGLLLDTETVYQDAWIEYGKQYGFAIDNVLVSSLRGQNEARIKKISQQVLGEKFVFEHARDYCFDYLGNKIDLKQVKVKKGAVELLEYLKKNNIPTALATSSGEKIAKSCLESANLLDYFSVLTFGNMVQNSKPSPDIFLLAAQLLNKDVKECVIIEDSFNGVRAANAANGIVCMVPDMDAPTAEIKKMANVVLSDLAQVIEFIEKYNL